MKDLSKKPHSSYMREWRKHGRTRAQQQAWEADHAFPIPVLTMFDLIRNAALFFTCDEPKYSSRTVR